MTFSQRLGRKPPKKDIQIQSMDEELRNGLWNVIDRNYFEPFISKRLGEWIYFELFKNVWDELFKLRLNELRTFRSLVEFKIREFEPRFNGMKWNEVYDLIEYLEQNTAYEPLKSKFKFECNKVLEREFSAYSFVGEQIVQLTSTEEKNEIEKAMHSPLESINIHLETALQHISNKDNPDYRNSIKESISAVEAACLAIAGQNKETLGRALNHLLKNSKDTISIPENLNRAFHNLYAYASEEHGIRHSLLEEPNLTFADARFMLIACSAFVNYLVSKADDANIHLS